ncbi:MAG: transcriptional regulator GcvA [Proteobacteria bacterium]|nr:transcriptional regulator GcvA [Pseudomonadota bacterium]
MAGPRRLLPLNALRAFEAAARHLSFTKAADELHVTPGAISQHVRQLEDHAGGALFRRDGRGLELTETGRAALPLLREGFERLLDASALLREPPRRRQLSVSVAPSFAGKWLMPRMERFHAEHPDVEVWISADMEIVDLSEGAVDVAIRYGRGQYPDVIAERLLQETVLPVCSPALLEGKNPIRSPKDLAQHTLLHDLSIDQDPSCPDWAMWLKARGISSIDPRRGPRFNQSALVIEAAVMGQGVGLAKRSLAQADLEKRRLVAPFADGSTTVDFAYHVVLPRNRPPSAGAQLFVEWLKREAVAYENNMDQL